MKYAAFELKSSPTFSEYGSYNTTEARNAIERLAGWESNKTTYIKLILGSSIYTGVELMNLEMYMFSFCR